MAEQSFNIDGGLISSGIVTATKFKKDGGSVNSFLKADGSVDNNTYSTTDTNTTYTTGAADGSTADKKNITLIDNANNTVGVVTLIAGNNITLSRQNKEITITGDTVDTDTTYAVTAGDGSTANQKTVIMTAGGSGSGTAGIVTFVGGSNIDLTRDGDEITIAASAGTNITYNISAQDHGSDSNKKLIRLGNSDSGTDDVTLAGGNNITLSRSGDEISISGAAESSTLSDVVSRGGTTTEDVSVKTLTASEHVNVGSALTVTGNTDLNGNLDVDAHTDLDNVNIAGVTTFASNIDANGNLDVTGNITATGNLDVGAGLDVTGNITATQAISGRDITLTDSDPAINFVDSGDNPDYQIVVNSGHFMIKDSTAAADRFYINASSTTITNNLNVSENATFNKEIDVDGHTYLDNVSVSGACTVTGDFTVLGTTTLINSTNLNIGDNILTLNDDVTGTPSENAGVEVERGTSNNTSVRWNETTDKWQFTNDGTTYSDIGTSSTDPVNPDWNATSGLAEILNKPNITDTTYSTSSVSDSNNVKLRLTGSDSSTDDVLVTAGSQVNFSSVTANGFTINSTATTTQVPSGIVVLWSGASNAIPTGWSLCDGTGSTPDLRDKFIVGAGNNYSVDATGGSANTPVVSHTHGIGNISGNTSNTGSHTHGSGNYSTSNTGDHSHSQSGSGSGNTGNQSNNHYHTLSTNVSTNNTGSHTHNVPWGDSDSYGGPSTVNYASSVQNPGNIVTNSAGGHSHSFNITADTLGISANHTHSFNFNIGGNTGNTGSHSHNVNSGSSGSGGSHSHNVSISGNTGSTGNTGTNTNLPPYYALCYIRKD